MTHYFDEEERDKWLEDISQLAAARCRESNIRHPGDIADQLIIVAEVLAEYESNRS